MWGRALRLALLIAAAATAPAAATASAAATPRVTVEAGRASAVQLPAHPGPGGVPIPSGACGARIAGRVWVLPCSGPAVAAADRTALAQVRRRAETRARQRALFGLAGALALVAVLTACERGRRRREAARRA